jgi:hypothetical protein
VLIKQSRAGDGFKERVQTVRAWRACWGDGTPGTPYDLALKAAHELRDTLDAYVQHLRRR